MSEFSGTGLAAMAAGAVLVYGGITGKSPLAALYLIVRGKPPTGATQVNPIINPNNPANSGQPNSSNPGTQGDQGASSGAPGGAPSANKAIGRMLAAAYGWTGAEFDALDRLWVRESGWQNDIANRSSGAFGIAQALGHGTDSSAASGVHVRYPDGGSEVKTVNEYPSKAANAGNAGAQITWGLRYIKDRYGSPSAAWAHEVANSWY